jgi:hypothetical protein
MASPLSKILRRPPGKGWLVLTGANPREEQILRILALVQHAGSVLALTPRVMDVASAEIALGDWLEPSGWLGRARAFGALDSLSADALYEEVEESALIVFPDIGDAASIAEALALTDLPETILAAMDDGVVCVACGVAAEVLGEWLVLPDGQAVPGLGWIPSSVLQAHFESQTPCPILTKRPGLFRLGLPGGAALALGPEQERELWGEEKPTLTFGIGWNA